MSDDFDRSTDRVVKLHIPPESMGDQTSRDGDVAAASRCSILTGGFVVLLVLSTGPQAPELRVELIGNAGVVLSDGATSLLVDLPYESGAFGYMHYEPGNLRPTGVVVSVITHHHRDHFDRGDFLTRTDWRLIGPPSVTRALPPDRVLLGDSVQIGQFAVVPVPTPHTDDHRSYRVRWRGSVLYFVGDTQDLASVTAQPMIDVLFTTPWLNCTLVNTGKAPHAVRSILYHLRPDGDDRLCGSADVLGQGSVFVLPSNAERRTQDE